MAVPCDVCLDVSTVQFFLLSFHSVTALHYYYPPVVFMEFTDMPFLQLECNYGGFLSHATYECNLQEKIMLINVSAACYIIIIPPQKKRKKQRSPQRCSIIVALTWDVGQWERSVIVMWKGTLKDKVL
jgi:hypothetical protein